ncbi:MAG: phage tail sheath family protein [Candidatus Binataceae bacterium]
MPASFLHGVEVIEVTTGPLPITVVKSAVIGLVGTAPTWAVEAPAAAPAVNSPVLVSSARDAANLGPLVRGYSIPYALNAIQQQGAGQCIVVNVFDITKHNSQVTNGAYPFPALPVAQAISLGHMGILPGSVVIQPAAAPADWTASHAYSAGNAIKPAAGNPGGYVFKCTAAGTSGASEPSAWNQAAGSAVADGSATWTNIGVSPYVENTDYTVDYVNGVITQKTGGSMSANESVTAAFSYADPTKVQDSDIVGSVTGSAYSGIQAFQITYGSMGFFPKILIAPGFSQTADVASALTEMADTVRAIALIDSPPATASAVAMANRGVAGNAFDTSNPRAVLCYPQESFYDTGLVPAGVTLNSSGAPAAATYNAAAVGPYSQWVAGAIAAKDLAQGYWWSPSNTQINGILGPDVSLYASIVDPNCDVNNLNAAGIVTVFNAYGTGLRVWGNRSSAYPSSTAPANFISIRRTMDVIEESVQQAMLQFIDQPISNALIGAILASVNAFIRTLVQRGALVAGAASYDPAENPPNQVSAGQLVFDIDVMPPPPAERITFQTYIDITLLSQLGQTNAMPSSAASSN